jgi:ubiquinone/menaquinone biosynthesis C-methylase UbiE
MLDKTCWTDMIVDMEEEYHAVRKQKIEMKPIETDGLILDIGGGGEGIIGRLNGNQVVAIDKRIDELQETKNDSLKIVMDATDLKFLPSSFDAATSFFSLMYIKKEHHITVFEEVHKVLKEGGKFFLWEVIIPVRNGDKRVFVLPLEVLLPSSKVETGYGVGWENKEQDLQYFKELAQKTAFNVIGEWSRNEIFYLCLAKP